MAKPQPRSGVVRTDTASFLPEGPGLYCVFDPDGGLQYIGKAQNLRARWNSHPLKSMQEAVVTWCEVPTSHLDNLETFLIALLKPPHNKRIDSKTNQLFLPSPKHGLKVKTGDALYSTRRPRVQRDVKAFDNARAEEKRRIAEHGCEVCGQQAEVGFGQETRFLCKPHDELWHYWATIWFAKTRFRTQRRKRTQNDRIWERGFASFIKRARTGYPLVWDWYMLYAKRAGHQFWVRLNDEQGTWVQGDEAMAVVRKQLGLADGAPILIPLSRLIGWPGEENGP